MTRHFQREHETQARLAPLFRWAGSKRKLLPELTGHVPASYGRYIEPFTGSACLFFALSPIDAILSDLNEELMHAYEVLRSHPKLLCRAVTEMPRTEAYYYALRNKTPDSLDDLARAARFLYLNRH